MSAYRLDIVMERIEAAPASSPVAVFKSADPQYLNAVFASTYHTQKLIREGDENYIGTFHRRMNMDAVRQELTRYLRPAA